MTSSRRAASSEAAAALTADLRRRLAALAHEDAALVPAAFHDLLARAGSAAADRRRYTPGHLTASALALDPEGRAVCLVHHRRLGRWLQPGGHVEPGERSLAETARRELLEETGLEAAGPLVLLALDVHDIPAGSGEPAHRHFDCMFLARSAGTRLRPSREVAGARWASLEAPPPGPSDSGLAKGWSRLHSLLRAGTIPGE